MSFYEEWTEFYRHLGGQPVAMGRLVTVTFERDPPPAPEPSRATAPTCHGLTLSGQD